MSTAVRVSSLTVLGISLIVAILYVASCWKTRGNIGPPPKGSTLESVYGRYGKPIEQMTCSEAFDHYKLTKYGDFKMGCRRVLVFDARVYDGGLFLGSWWTENHIIGFDSNWKTTSYASTLK